MPGNAETIMENMEKGSVILMLTLQMWAIYSRISIKIMKRQILRPYNYVSIH